MKSYIVYIVIMFVLTSCIDETLKETTVLEICLNFDKNIIITNKSGIECKINNVLNGRKYTVKTNVEGKSKLNVEQGIYDISASYNLINVDKSIDNLNANRNKIVVTNANSNMICLEMTAGIKSAIIIKQMYYSGCKTEEGKSYFSDQFIELYNNSNEILYLDNLGVGVVDGTSFSKTKWRDEDDNLLDRLPLNIMGWKFPGNGEDYPIIPGQSIIIAQNAINHKDDPIGNSMSPVDLSKADFETYFNPSGKDTDNPTVENMILLYSTSASINDWILNSTGTSLILFKIDGDWENFLENENNFMYRPGVNHPKYPNLMIPKEWVLDGVETVRSAIKNHKRLHVDIDAGYVYSIVRGGKAIHRKVQKVKANGQIIYKDTNNTTNDFDTNQTPVVNNIK